MEGEACPPLKTLKMYDMLIKGDKMPQAETVSLHDHLIGLVNDILKMLQVKTMMNREVSYNGYYYG